MLVFGAFIDFIFLPSLSSGKFFTAKQKNAVLNCFFIDGSWRFRIKKKTTLDIALCKVKLHNSSKIFNLFEHCLKINLLYLRKKGREVLV